MIEILRKETLTSWNFKLDNTVEFISAKIFSKEECETIVNFAKSHLLQKATVYNSIEDDKIRDSFICWLYPSEDTKWIYEKITDFVKILNDEYYKYDLTGFQEPFQFTCYKAPSGFYGKHLDVTPNSRIRKLSLSIQLTDPKEYEGGDVRFYYGDNHTSSPKEQGTIIMFPSFVLHEVVPVTKGIRNSLVAWVTGPAFK